LLYLMIAFVILAIAGWVMWGFTYSAKNEIELAMVGQSRLKAAQESGRDVIRELCDKYKNKPMQDVVEAETRLADGYGETVQHLASTLAGTEIKTTGDALRTEGIAAITKATLAMTEANDNLNKSYEAVKDQPTTVNMTSTIVALKALQQRITDLVARVSQADGAKKTVDGELTASKEQLAAVQQEQSRQLAQKDADFSKEKKDLDDGRASAVKAAKQVSDDLQRLMDRLIQERRAHAQEKTGLEQKITAQLNTVNELRKRLEPLTKLPNEMAISGHIISLADSGRVAYCDLGKDDGILMGMTFSIMSPSEVGKEEAKPKGAARIVKILGHSSEMRIFPATGSEPVIVNDLLFNPIYDRTRRLHFVLVGKMDVNGDGSDQTEALKSMIQKFGGKVDNQLSLQTDFLVVGEQPELRAAPAADASPEERQAYENSRKAFLDYSDAKAKADSTSIPVMNLNRFLGLTGLAGGSGGD
jgi:hypothetical protein